MGDQRGPAPECVCLFIWDGLGVCRRLSSLLGGCVGVCQVWVRTWGSSVVLEPSCTSGGDGAPAARQRVGSAGGCAAGVVAGERSPSGMRITPALP